MLSPFMPGPEFRFKQFSVRQDKCAMKVGTDGVLLGAWTQPGDADYILDVGTGTGLIALMMAQNSEAVIHAIDIDGEACLQAGENFRRSQWADRIKVFHTSLQHYAAISLVRYDLIVSNPPFFIDAHKALSEARNIARHLDETLSIPELLYGVKKLLGPKGRFCVIFPQKEALRFLEYATTHGLYVTQITRVKTKVEKQEKRMMMEFSLVLKPFSEDEIVIQEEDLTFTREYVELTSEFYLKDGGRKA